MLLLAAVVVCGALAALLVYRYDLYDREPWPGLVATAVLGAVLMWGAEAAERFVLVRHGGDTVASATAAATEELLRLAFVAAVALLFPRTFDDPMDGIVYGSILGLGMGLEESVVVLRRLPPGGWEGLPGEVVRLLGHLVMGGITGFGVGLARMRLPGWALSLSAAVAASMALHFLWDLVALQAPVTAAGAVLRDLTAVGVMLAGILLYGFLVTIASDLSRRVFAPRSLRTLWGWPFTLLRAGPERAPGDPRAAHRARPGPRGARGSTNRSRP